MDVDRLQVPTDHVANAFVDVDCISFPPLTELKTASLQAREVDCRR